MAAPRMCLILSENWTMTSGRDLPALVRWAREAEDAGFDSVMVSEHIVLGPAAGDNGRMLNPREYALPGNQDPATPWPSSLVLLSAIAAVTERVRLVAGAVIAPLRHPLLLARELGSLDLISGGRLVVLPTVSWLAEEYAALGVPFGRRGDLLDEHLRAWAVLWRDTPASHEGEHYSFRDVYFEPKAFRPGGPVLWPDLEAILVVPNNAHALFARPMVTSPDATIAIEIEAGGNDALVFCDGRREMLLPAGGRLEVTRCATPVSGELTIAVNERFGDAPIAEDELYPITDDTIDLGLLVRDAIVLELPMAPLCREDCRGLCPQCGADRNEGDCACVAPKDPRWANLDVLR